MMHRFYLYIPVLLITVLIPVADMAYAGTGMTACVNQPVYFNWTSTGATTGTPSYTGGCVYQMTNVSGGKWQITAPSQNCSAGLTVSNSGGSASDQATLTIDTSKTWNGNSCVTNGPPPPPPPPPPPAPTASIWVNPTTIASQGYTTYYWTSANADYCRFYIDMVYKGDTTSGYTLSNTTTGKLDGPIAANRTYYINCQNSSTGQYVWASAMVTVNAAPPPTPSATISASPNPCLVAQNATTCSTGVTWSILNAASPNAFSNYTNSQFSTSASGNNVSQTVPFAGTSFAARNGSSILASTPANAICANGLAYSGGTCIACSNGGCTGPGGGPNNPTGGLTCNNGGTNPPTCTPLVITPTATLSASPSTIDSGQSSTLTWSSTNATMCGAAGGASWLAYGSPTSGSTNVSPTSTSNYQVTCLNASGSANSNIVTITVTVPTVSITASPSRVHTGGSSSIAWSASQVKSCSVSGPGVSSTALSGSKNVNNITVQSTYTITCQTNGSPMTQTAIVNIIPDFQEF